MPHFWPIPFSPPLERATLPSCERIVEAVREIARF
jgi:pyruvate/2-oxoglutarate/acetoin dehydrogenase E1 component